uniref:MPN domain-containing protein n=1 Tax=Leersia perrieri TaxID=77586 RepID=A0A0D9V1A8_9ORYZ
MSIASIGQAMGGINVEAMARPVAVDHRISLAYYFRIADNLLRQANIYREEKNLLDLYIILLRYSRYGNLPCPKEETLSRHSILGSNGLHGQWAAPVTGIRIQYPSNAELTQSDISSLVPAILNQDQYGHNISQDFSTNKNEDMQTVLSLDDGRWSLPIEEPTSVSSGFEQEFSQLNIRQPCPPPVMAQVHPQHREVSTSTFADLGPGLATSNTGCYQNLHVPVTLMECFLRVAEANTANNLETCGILAGTLCQATNEEEIFEVQDKGSLFTLGWIHTHPTQTCFLSSIDLHNHYSYQVMLPEAIAIVMAPTDTTRKHGIFHLTDPGGMGVIHDCQESGFHPHEEPLDGTSIYEHCSHVYMNPNVKFDMVDLREL